MIIKRKSMFTGIVREMELPVTDEQWATWNSDNPPLIQNVFPQLTPDQREFILSGVTKEEWDQFMPEEEDWSDERDNDEQAF